MLESAFGWVGQLAEWLGSFVPRLNIVDTRHAMIKFVRGKKIVVCPPGLHWHWPLVTVIDTYPTVRQGEELRTQAIVTTDDKVIAVGGMIIYDVEDVEMILAHTYMPTLTIKDISLTAIHDVCARMSWEELKDGQRRGTLDTRLKNEAQKLLKDYGVRVLKVMLTDLSPAKVLKLINTNARGED